MAEHDDELRALRERAYGPGADIEDDAPAVDRLRELEDRSRREPRPADGSLRWNGDRRIPDAASPATVAVRVLSADAADEVGPSRDARGDAASVDQYPATATSDSPDAATVEGDPTTVVAPLSRRRWTRFVPLLWIGSVIAALVAGALAAGGTAELFTGRVTVLEVDVDATWPDGFLGDQPRESFAFEDFHGISPFVTPQQTTMGGEAQCLFLVAGSPNARGVMGGGCAAAPFRPVTSVTVTEQSPALLREAYPLGTALQFTLDGQSVLVDAREP